VHAKVPFDLNARRQNVGRGKNGKCQMQKHVSDWPAVRHASVMIFTTFSAQKMWQEVCTFCLKILSVYSKKRIATLVFKKKAPIFFAENWSKITQNSDYNIGPSSSDAFERKKIVFESDLKKLGF
jgi:hypothetical protein